jgi:hypothetical protein
MVLPRSNLHDRKRSCTEKKNARFLSSYTAAVYGRKRSYAESVTVDLGSENQTESWSIPISRNYKIPDIDFDEKVEVWIKKCQLKWWLN